jgi:hypothetical protein
MHRDEQGVLDFRHGHQRQLHGGAGGELLLHFVYPCCDLAKTGS